MLRIKSFKTSRATKWFLIGALSLTLTAALPILSLAQDSKQNHSGQGQEQEMKVPQTAQEHRERAEQYRKKAAAYRQEAESHRKMLDDYRKKVAQHPKEIGENAYIKKMRLHCERYIKAAENLAHEADEMAKFHTMRAKEMEGK